MAQDFIKLGFLAKGEPPLVHGRRLLPRCAPALRRTRCAAPRCTVPGRVGRAHGRPARVRCLPPALRPLVRTPQGQPCCTKQPAPLPFFEFQVAQTLAPSLAARSAVFPPRLAGTNTDPLGALHQPFSSQMPACRHQRGPVSACPGEDLGRQHGAVTGRLQLPVCTFAAAWPAHCCDRQPQPLAGAKRCAALRLCPPCSACPPCQHADCIARALRASTNQRPPASVCGKRVGKRRTACRLQSCPAPPGKHAAPAVALRPPTPHPGPWPRSTVTSKFNELVYQYPIRIPERYSLVIR